MTTILVTHLDGALDYCIDDPDADIEVLIIDLDALASYDTFPVDIDKAILQLKQLPPVPWRNGVIANLLELRRESERRLLAQDDIEGAPWLTS